MTTNTETKSPEVTPSDLWRGAFIYLTNVADRRLSAEDYAMAVRKLYDVLGEDTGDAERALEFLKDHVPEQHGRGLISKQHQNLALNLLPKPPRRKRGRPKGALGIKAHKKRRELYRDWIFEKSLNPSLTQKQFAKERLGITDEELEGEYALDHHYKIEALLQELKRAKMQQLDEEYRRAIELFYPLVATSPRHLAQMWRDAKQHSPALTKKEFLRDFLGWRRDGKRHRLEADMIRDCLTKLEQGEQMLATESAGSEHSDALASLANSKVRLPHFTARYRPALIAP